MEGSFDKETILLKDDGNPVERVKSNSIRQVLSRTITSASSRKSKKVTPIVKDVYPEMDLDNGLVGWEGQDDPAHPRNFPEKRKWLLLGFVSAITFLTYIHPDRTNSKQWQTNRCIVHYQAPSPRPVSQS